jgi:integrase
MRVSEIFSLGWSDVMYSEGLLAVRAKLKGGKMRYVPMPPELAGELRRCPAVVGEERIFPPKPGATGERQRVEGSFEDLLERAGIEDFRFHDLRHRLRPGS